MTELAVEMITYGFPHPLQLRVSPHDSKGHHADGLGLELPLGSALSSLPEQGKGFGGERTAKKEQEDKHKYPQGYPPYKPKSTDRGGTRGREVSPLFLHRGSSSAGPH